MPQQFQLDDETLKYISEEVQKEVEAGGLTLRHGTEFTLQSQGDSKRSELIRKLGKYIDFEAGGLKLLELEINSNPAQFLLVPSIDKEGVGVTLRFEYRF